MPTLRHHYPGGNTANGFYSYFDQILPFQKAVRIFILKGGPGVGKSTFMRKIGQHLLDKGFDIEHFHCASDNESLDGVLAPKIGLLFLDGTAPHTVDPKWPGAVDGIINLGDCLDDEGLAASRADIFEISGQITGWFLRAYRYLHAAECVRGDNAAIVASHLDQAGLSATADALIRDHLPVNGGSAFGAERKLFASAITPSGCVCTLSSQPAYHFVPLLGPWTTPTDLVLMRLRDEALRRGLDVEGYYCALSPARLEHVYIPSLHTLFYTVNPYHGQDLPYDQRADLNAHITVPTPQEQTLLVNNETLFQTLLGHATEALAQAKAQHDILETYYVSHMDYARADDMLAKTLAHIEALLP